MTRSSENESIRHQRGVEGPAWRWKLAQVRAPLPLSAFLNREDEVVQGARDYVALCRRVPDARQAAEKYPVIHAAQGLNQDDELRESLMVLTIANCRRSDIARRLRVDEAVIAMWERLFFDVRELRIAVGWVASHIIEPAVSGGNGRLAARLKLAWSGGPSAACAILDAESTAPIAAGENLYQQRVKLALKMEQAAAAPSETPRHQIRFLKLFVQLTLTEQRLCLAQQRLVACCQEALRRHERAERRMQTALRRGEQRIAERQRTAAQRDAKARLKRWQQEDAARQREAALAAGRKAGEEWKARSTLSRLRWFTAPSTAGTGSDIGCCEMAHDVTASSRDRGGPLPDAKDENRPKAFLLAGAAAS